MARQARIKDEFGIFHISQEGNPEHLLFRTDADKTKFSQLLKKAELKFQFNLYAYCLSADNRYDLVIDVNGSDLSSIMKSVNISYAMYRQAEGKLFKDRYKSKLLENQEAVDTLISQLKCSVNHNPNWQEIYELPSFKINLEPYFIDCMECITCSDYGYEKLAYIAASEQTSIDAIMKDKEKRNQLLKIFRKHSTLSLKELGTLFGGLSESSVCKILNDC